MRKRPPLADFDARNINGRDKIAITTTNKKITLLQLVILMLHAGYLNGSS